LGKKGSNEKEKEAIRISRFGNKQTYNPRDFRITLFTFVMPVVQIFTGPSGEIVCLEKQFKMGQNSHEYA
jgi:hypothetical protein